MNKCINKERFSSCQLYDVPLLPLPMQSWQVASQKVNRLRRILKRRYTYMMNLVNELTAGVDAVNAQSRELSLTKIMEAGDLVRVKSREEIQRSLNRWNQLKGCSFMEEMQPYCGTTQRVLKRVDKFLDERDYHTKRCKGIYLLEGVMCQGTIDFGPCDRSCFFFWRDEWLERVDY